MHLATEQLGTGSPRLVLVHGFTQTRGSWRPIAAELARDHEVVLVDAPGHGGSASIDADLDTGARLLGEAGASAVYVGYSMGGRLCLHLALARPELVRGLVLLGATAGIDDDADRAARKAADGAIAASIERDGVAAFLDRWLAQPLFASLPADEADRADRETNTVAGLASSLRRAGAGEQWARWGELSQLSMPVLVAAGALDTKFAVLAHRLTEAIGPHARVALIAGAGHAAHRERPAAFVALLRTWLDENHAALAGGATR